MSQELAEKQGLKFARIAALSEFRHLSYETGKREPGTLGNQDTGKIYVDTTETWRIDPIDPVLDRYTTGGYAFPLRESHFKATKTIKGLEEGLRTRDLYGPYDLLDIMNTRPNLTVEEENDPDMVVPGQPDDPNVSGIDEMISPETNVVEGIESPITSDADRGTDTDSPSETDVLASCF